MRNAAVEQLAKILSEQSNDDRGSRFHKLFEWKLTLDEGWFSFFLLAAVVYTTIWSVQAAGWVDHMGVLTVTTAIGLCIGIVAIKQRHIPQLLLHLFALLLSLLVAFWQAAGAYYANDFGAFAQAIHSWVLILFTGGTADDSSIFLFLIITLGFILAYASVWLVYRMRSPWLMIVANAVVFLINLSNVNAGYVILVPVFLLSALTLLLRFNLYESIKRWERMGLRYADDLSWDVMQAGILISIGILICSWILPWTYENPVAAQIWSADNNPIVQIENTWNRVISVNGGANPVNHGNFRDTLTLGGNPNLNNVPVYALQTNASSAPYLAFVSYSQYTGGQWSIGSAASQSDVIPANDSFTASALMTHQVKQTITVVNPPGEQYPYIIGGYQITSVSRPTRFLYDDNGTIIAWLGNNGILPAGTTYSVNSAISSADIDTLKSVPMPKDAPPYTSGPNSTDSPDAGPPITAYEPTTLRTYTRMTGNKDLDTFFHQKALSIVGSASTMYDKAVALESYLHDNYKYTLDIQPPTSQDPVQWFLTTEHQGFCNYFASAMTLLARSLGMPARMMAGYAVRSSDYDEHQGKYIVRGSEAHTWTQIYFAGYGWIDFEPSASFATFPRPTHPSAITGDNTAAGSATSNPFPTDAHKTRVPNQVSGGDGSVAATNSLSLGQSLGLGLGGLVLLGILGTLLFLLWWRRLFRGYSLPTQLYGRICLLANWAGIHMHPSQTPYEYLQDLSLSALPASTDAHDLERLGDIYVRERWAAPDSQEYPQQSSDVAELPDLWKRLQPHLFRYLLRHPYFLRWLPKRIGTMINAARQQRRAQRLRKLAAEDL